MVKLAPPTSVFDGLDLSNAKDRITALVRIQADLDLAERGFVMAGEQSKHQTPSAEQLSALWMALTPVSAAVRALAKVMIAGHTEHLDLDESHGD